MKTLMNAMDFYQGIEYLIRTSKDGYTAASIKVGTISTILLPSKFNDFRLSNEKEIAVMIDSLAKLEDLPNTFFEKPFFYPFNNKQLDQLKACCWCTPAIDNKGYLLEKKLISLYEKILVKQQAAIDKISSDLKGNFSNVLSVRIEVLDTALTKINKQISALETRQHRLEFFDSKESTKVKVKQLKEIRDVIKPLRDEYATGTQPSFLEKFKKVGVISNYLESTEAQIHSAFEVQKNKSGLKKHNNLFMKFIDGILKAITFGFVHISTKTEAVISEARSSINKQF